mgnify:CR=1 FL=1
MGFTFSESLKQALEVMEELAEELPVQLTMLEAAADAHCLTRI